MKVLHQALDHGGDELPDKIASLDFGDSLIVASDARYVESPFTAHTLSDILQYLSIVNGYNYRESADESDIHLRLRAWRDDMRKFNPRCSTLYYFVDEFGDLLLWDDNAKGGIIDHELCPRNAYVIRVNELSHDAHDRLNITVTRSTGVKFGLALSA